MILNEVVSIWCTPEDGSRWRVRVRAYYDDGRTFGETEEHHEPESEVEIIQAWRASEDGKRWEEVEDTDAWPALDSDDETEAFIRAQDKRNARGGGEDY
jgi:predicted dehydrogenase